MNENPGNNVPGRGARKMANLRRQLRILLVLASIALVANLFLVNLTARNILVSLLVLAALLVLDRMMHAELDRLEKRERDATRGAKAEETIGVILNRLPIESRLITNPARFVH